VVAPAAADSMAAVVAADSMAAVAATVVAVTAKPAYSCPDLIVRVDPTQNSRDPIEREWLPV
jgi:hypothetical protein